LRWARFALPQPTGMVVEGEPPAPLGDEMSIHHTVGQAKSTTPYIRYTRYPRLGKGAQRRAQQTGVGGSVSSCVGQASLCHNLPVWWSRESRLLPLTMK